MAGNLGKLACEFEQSFNLEESVSAEFAKAHSGYDQNLSTMPEKNAECFFNDSVCFIINKALQRIDEFRDGSAGTASFVCVTTVGRKTTHMKGSIPPQGEMGTSYPDIVGCKGGAKGLNFTAELKDPNKLETVADKGYVNVTMSDFDASVPVRHDHRALAQALGYSLDAGCLFGFVTNVNKVYFYRVEERDPNDPRSLRVSTSQAYYLSIAAALRSGLTEERAAARPNMTTALLFFNLMVRNNDIKTVVSKSDMKDFLKFFPSIKIQKDNVLLRDETAGTYTKVAAKK